MTGGTPAGGWLAAGRRRLWEEASFLANYHLRLRAPTLVRALEAAHGRYLVPAPPVRRLVAGRGEGTLRLAVAFREPRLERLLVDRLAGPGASAARPASGRADAPVDLELAEVPALDRAGLARAGCFVLPLWVRQVVELGAAPSIVPASRHSRRRVKLIHRRGYDWELARDPRSFDEFYHRMYLPTMRARHGANAYVRGPRYIGHGLRHGVLLFVRRDGRRVAGVLNVVHPADPAQVTTWAGGLLDGDLRLLAEDADSACIYFTLRWAREQGRFRRVSLSVTRPFLDDGLLRYRKRWGARLEPEDAWAWNVVALRIRRWTPAVRAALDATPFIVAGRDGLCGVARWPGEVNERVLDTGAPGLRSLTWIVEEAAEGAAAPPPGDAVCRLPAGDEVPRLEALARALAG